MEQTTETNHRTRVGREKRERMRERILLALMACYEEQGGDAEPDIDRIIQHAHISRATFYLYFDSIEGVRRALLSKFDEDLVAVEVFFEESNPLARLATGIMIFLFRSLTDSAWARFVSSTNYLLTNESYIKVLQGHLLTAKRAGLIQFRDVAAASSLLLGTKLAAMRFLAKADTRRRKFVEELTVMILCGLGAEPECCRKIVEDRIKYIRACAPHHIPWWKDPWLR